jgi:hypothetical protein
MPAEDHLRPGTILTRRYKGRIIRGIGCGEIDVAIEDGDVVEAASSIDGADGEEVTVMATGSIVTRGGLASSFWSD